MEKINKPYFIAEIGLNYDKNIDQALLMIQKAEESGAHAAKFQTLNVSELVNPYLFDKSYEAKPNEFFEMLKGYELSEEEHAILAKECQKVGIDFISSAFDLRSLEIVGRYCDAIKIASSELTHHDLLRACGKYKKPVFISMGMGTLEELKEAIDILKVSGVETIYPLYCVSLYPLPFEEAKLNVVRTLKSQLDLTVGFSDHTQDDTLAIASIALGGCIVEKHVTLKRENRLFDHGFSMEFEEFQSMVLKIDNLFKALGSKKQFVGTLEEKVKSSSRRSFFATRDLSAGEALIVGDNIKALRPVVGVSLEEEAVLQSKKIKKSVKAYHPIFQENLESL